MKFEPGNLMHRYALFVLLIICMGCADIENEPAHADAGEAMPAVIQEVYFTPRDTTDNVDSPAVWHGDAGENWLIATAKETDMLLVFDAATGELIRRVGGSGKQAGALDRPNGVAVIDSFAIIVERDNARVQVFSLPNFNALGLIGEGQLIRPYGISLAS